MPKCPFTGADVQIRKTKAGPLEAPYWMGVVESPLGGYTTRLFQFESQLLDFLNLRDGKPVEKVQHPVIQVTHPDYTVGITKEDENQKERDLDDTVQVAAARTAKHVRDGRSIKSMR